ncbi:hypothetical protein niasHS_017150 [Heterodera schachtii]|uniref:Uncharacterized protein n=1 Tax=Heterodera schachtii TaxID=97005 RepID=A0ABD2IBQ9_HETSC
MTDYIHVKIDKVTRNYVEELVKSEKHLLSLRQFAVEWAHNNALIFRNKKVPPTTDVIYRSDVAVIAPFSLFPSPFPRHAFEHALAVQKALNLLYFRVDTKDLIVRLVICDFLNMFCSLFVNLASSSRHLCTSVISGIETEGRARLIFEFQTKCVTGRLIGRTTFMSKAHFDLNLQRVSGPSSTRANPPTKQTPNFTTRPPSYKSI